MFDSLGKVSRNCCQGGDCWVVTTLCSYICLGGGFSSVSLSVCLETLENLMFK
jgi:hypothetical protein